MVLELSSWKIDNRNVRKLGEEVSEMNIELSMLEGSMQEAAEEECLPNMHRARGLNRRLRNLIDKAGRYNPNRGFDKLALGEFRHSLETQLEFVRFFYTGVYHKMGGTKDFLNYMFSPESGSPAPWNSASAYNFLWDSLRGVDQSKQTKRENLMRDISIFDAESCFNGNDLERIMLDELFKVRKVLADFNFHMGFETQEQINIRGEMMAADPAAEAGRFAVPAHHYSRRRALLHGRARRRACARRLD